MTSRSLAPTRGRPGETHPVRSTTVTGSHAHLANLARNPNTRAMTEPVQRPDGTWQAQIRYIDRTQRVLTREEARRRQRVRKAARIAAAVAAVLVGTFGTGWMAWTLWGDSITAALKLAATCAAVTALIALGFWWTNHGSNGCPGLHCKGCKGH